MNSRAEAFRNVLRSLSDAITNLQIPEFTASTPTHSAPPPLNFGTPIGNSNLLTSPIDATMSPNFATYPKSYIRDALELVPKYDGHNIPVWQFARACKRAKEAVPLVDETLLVRMLRNKLSHHAYLAVEDETHLTVSKFLDTLKRTFGPGRSSNYYRGQLSIAFKKTGEHILDYIGRIKDLRTAIIEGDQTNLDRTLTEIETSAIDSYALEAFFEGLPREYRTELKAEGYTNFAEACSKVITIHKRLEREEARYRNSRNTRNDTGYNNNSAPIRVSPRDTACASSPAPHNNANANAPTGATDNAARKICTYCKNFGHLFNECRKRQFYLNNAGKSHTNTTLTPPVSGNYPEASAKGTTRGLGNVRPVLSLECSPEESTYSEPIMGMYPSSSSILLPSEDQ
ncbi:hypothetical protein ALC62_03470 [Cyphomyrmex costatus]|uniref:CCHC-type domain-containing protein n=1 Tax=Cyphomyrmex costatus TaxID=456900 RepID=A0A151ILJ0_9HYME|nr:hypothetical protein ALC62_03470 [Cyphomyrmex costatus]